MFLLLHCVHKKYMNRRHFWRTISMGWKYHLTTHIDIIDVSLMCLLIRRSEQRKQILTWVHKTQHQTNCYSSLYSVQCSVYYTHEMCSLNSNVDTRFSCYCCYYNSMYVACSCFFGDPSKCQTELPELGMA